MNIQIDLVIWTVINFCLLYFVLKYLLFKPMLANMDKRNEKIESARLRREQKEQQREVAKAEHETRLAEAKAARRERETEQLRRIEEDCAELKSNAEAERRMLISDRQNELSHEKDELCALAESRMDTLKTRLAARFLAK